MENPNDGRILRSIFLEPKVDSEYRRTAYMMGTNKAELMRRVLDFGIALLNKFPKYDIDSFQEALDALLKSGIMASVVVSDATERKIKSVLPEWLKTEPGFRFIDGDGDTYIVLGFGGWREWENQGAVTLANGPKTYTVCNLKFREPTLVGAMLYKGEFSIIDIVAMEGLTECRPLPLGGD